MPSTADVLVQIGPQTLDIHMLGERTGTIVRRTAPIGPLPNMIETELVMLSLTGISPMGPVNLMLNPLAPPSLGRATANQPSPDLPATSFFDIFVEVDLPSLGMRLVSGFPAQPGNPASIQPLPVRVVLESLKCVPPGPGERFCTPPTFTVPLTDLQSGQVVGQILRVWHTIIEPNHFKVWRVQPVPIVPPLSVVAKDQFGTNPLQLSQIDYLSNPVQKTVAGQVFNFFRPDDHLNWYLALAPPIPPLSVQYKNQFESTGVVIDNIVYFCVPTRKFPHPTPQRMDHYTGYRIQNPQMIIKPVRLQDQFDVPNFEFIDSLLPLFFFAPAQKNTEPVYDTVTHYVAYRIFPQDIDPRTVDTEDQFGIHGMNVQNSEFLMVPTRKFGFTPAEEACCFTGPAGSLMCALVPAGTCESVYGGTVVPACLGDGNGNGVDDACDGPPTTGPNHFKTWRVLEQNPTGSRTVIVQDQLMQDNIVLDSIQYLSNPTRKTVLGPNPVTYPVLDSNDHLSWYGAIGRDTLLGIEFRNQFGHDTVNIDRVKYLLVPTRKFPHDPPVRLDHYKAYRIRSAKTLRQPIELEDQFDRMGPPPILPERIDSLKERYFLTPAQKQRPGLPPEPVYDTVTHYVAYQIYPTRRVPHIRDVEDQFSPPVHILQIDSAELLLVPTRKLKVIFPPPPEEACCYIDPTGVQVCDSVPVGQCVQVYGGTTVPACLGDGNGNGNDDACEPPPPDTGSNHYKTWRVFQQDQVVFRTVFAKDQFQKFKKDSTVRVDTIHYLSNPTRKIVFDATGADTFNVVDTTDHLAWYRATGYNLLKGLHVVFQNQFHTDTNRVDRVQYFLLPTRKFPHQPPDRLDHYKAYRIRKPRTLRKPFELQDQFDLMNPTLPFERIDSLTERYFLTPTQKQIPGQQPEPTYDTVTHYVAYQIYPSQRMPHIRDTEDQFGIHILQVDSSELLLVPTNKLFVARKLKGDMNGSLDLTSVDVVLMLNCAFLGTGDCDVSFSDVNCDGVLTSVDIVLELNAVFLDGDFPC